MQPEIRRIIAVDAHRRRIGRCPTLVHSLGTGESFAIEPTPDGFVDVQSGLRVRSEAARIVLPGDGAAIDIALDDDIAFSGYDPASGERFTGRAGGGSSVTVYDDRHADYFQYAVVHRGSDGHEQGAVGDPSG
jgi:hypothetical protein